MATYTAITDAEIDQDSPVTQTLMTKYRDNLIATAEGAAGAPRIEDAALDTTVTTAGTNWVLARSAASVGVVGSYAFVRYITVTDTDLAPGATVAGSALRYASISIRTDSLVQISFGISTVTLSGTWRVMGFFAQNDGSEDTFGQSLVLRIS